MIRDLVYFICCLLARVMYALTRWAGDDYVSAFGMEGDVRVEMGQRLTIMDGIQLYPVLDQFDEGDDWDA